MHYLMLLLTVDMISASILTSGFGIQ